MSAWNGLIQKLTNERSRLFITNNIFNIAGSLLLARQSLFINLTTIMKTENIIRSGFNPRQIYILETLLEKESCSLKELTSDFMSRVNLTNAVDVLEMKRLVKRMRDIPDRRSVSVTLTEAGKQFISNIS